MSLPTQSATTRSPSTRSSNNPPTSRMERARALFSRRSNVETSTTSTTPPQSPKTPMTLNMEGLSSFTFPPQTTTTTSPRSSVGPAQVPTIIITSQPTTPNSQQQQPQQPSATAVPAGSRPTSAQRFVDPADQHLADLVSEGRRRKNKPEVVERRCFRKIANKETRARVTGTLIAGLVKSLSKRAF